MQMKKEEISQGVLAAEQEIMKLQSNNDLVKVCNCQTLKRQESKSHFTSFSHRLVFVLYQKCRKLKTKDAVFSPLEVEKTKQNKT